MSRLLPRVLLTLVAASATLAVQGQEYSYDGNRWYEVEVLVFRHLGAEFQISEAPDPLLPGLVPGSANTPLLRELASPLDPFLIDFEAMRARLDSPPTDGQLDYGPERLPPGGDFRLMDFARDGWIALPSGLWGLARDHQRLEASPAHALLWHQAWRQPLLGPAQAPAVAANAQDAFGTQHLAGSIRLLPFSSGTLRVAVDLRLTLEGAVWTLQEQRDLLPGTFHYFDNPTFGVVLRVQPYVLPPRTSAASDSDF